MFIFCWLVYTPPFFDNWARQTTRPIHQSMAFIVHLLMYFIAYNIVWLSFLAFQKSKLPSLGKGFLKSLCLWTKLTLQCSVCLTKATVYVMQTKLDAWRNSWYPIQSNNESLYTLLQPSIQAVCTGLFQPYKYILNSIINNQSEASAIHP